MITAKDIEDMDDNNIMWQYYNPPKEDQMSVMEMVKEFSKVLDQKPDPDLYSRLIIEEYQEWLLDPQSGVEELKELADLVYVIYGYANAKGYNLDEALSRVHASNLYPHLITKEYQEWLLDVQTEEEELKELADLVYAIYGYANAKGYNLDEALRRVHANNLGRCIQPDGSIHRREDGKIIKNKDYPKVKLDDIV